MGLRLVCERELAADSPDHLFPQGTWQDNSRDPEFVRKVVELLHPYKPRVLDIGCAGGGMVKDFVDLGYTAIGLDGSNLSREAKRAEWATIPDNLFVCDATRRFLFRDEDGYIQFNLITAWEVFEHFRQEDLATVFLNLYDNSLPGTLLIVSVATVIDPPRHQTVQSQEWWTRVFADYGWPRHGNLERYFEPDYVRGPKHGETRSLTAVMVRA